MKKNIILSLISLIILASCAPPKTAQRRLNKNDAPYGGQSAALSVNEEYQTIPRDSSTVLIPLEEDFSTTTRYRYDEASGTITVEDNGASEGFSWQADVNFAAAFDGTQFANLPSRIFANEPNSDKLRKVVLLVLSAGSIRDNGIVELHAANNLYESTWYARAMQISEELLTSNNRFKRDTDKMTEKYLCFNPRETQEGLYSCDYIDNESRDIENLPTSIKAKSCYEIQEKFKFTLASRSERKMIRDLKKCNRPVKRKLNNWKTSLLTPITNRREAAKGLVEHLLQSLKERTGISYIQYIRTQQDDEMILKSRFFWSPQQWESYNTEESMAIATPLKDNESLYQLMINFDAGQGDHIYSDEKQNLEWSVEKDYTWNDRHGVTMLNLQGRHQHLGGLPFRATLSLDIHPIYGLRLTGKFYASGIDGKEREGGLKLEFDKQEEIQTL